MAARLGDARGDDALALRTLEKGLERFPDAPLVDRARALLYRAELAVRVGNDDLARSSFVAVRSLALSADERADLASEVAHVSELVGERPDGA